MALIQTSFLRFGPLTSCKGRARLAAASRTRQPFVLRTAFLSEPEVQTSHLLLCKSYRLAIAGVLASGLVWLSPSPVEADMQTVSPQMVTQMARPLPKQTVDKGKIWSIFIGGAVLLFGITVAFENNEKFFPAITRANRAFRTAAKEFEEMEERQKKEEELLRLRQVQYDEEQRQLSVVQLGMQEARTKVLGTGAAAAPVAAAEPESSSSHPVIQASTSTNTSSSAGGDAAPYVVVEDVVSGIGAVAWPPTAAAATAAGSAVASTSVHVEEVPTQAASAANVGAPLEPPLLSDTRAVASADDAELMTRVARLQGFVSGTISGSKSALEAYRTQRQ
ncbi:hypothetical protein VaNZ11_009315 [Volvox africanus]|uniref:Transmembrane protein n=1 Tax=Volvox africanus TaxID=51714 RepID=A0ABQ5S8G3_9CHLO|nr:hypothetical protein VaNZ11_009315 [Volvox africanus]